MAEKVEIAVLYIGLHEVWPEDMDPWCVVYVRRLFEVLFPSVTQACSHTGPLVTLLVAAQRVLLCRVDSHIFRLRYRHIPKIPKGKSRVGRAELHT